MGKKIYHSGQIADVSGQLKNTATKTEVTVVKGERIPPTPKPNQNYVLVDQTKHKK